MTLYWVKTPLLGRLAIAARPRGGDWLCDELFFCTREGLDILVSLLTGLEAEELGLGAESEECESAGLRFLSFPIEDRSLPYPRSEFVTFVDRLAQELREGKSIAAHCRAGIGRSVMLIACILVRCGVTPREALKNIEDARGCPVPDTLEQVNFIQHFGNR